MSRTKLHGSQGYDVTYNIMSNNSVYIQVVILYFHLAYPLYAFCTEFRSGLNLLIKRFSFSFLSIILSEFILKRET